MTGELLTFRENVTLIGGGELSRETLEEVLTRAPHLVAADGAARAALAMGLMPEAVIGDMDSLDAETRAALPGAILHRIVEQDSTDFDKALRSIEAPLILAAGFMGARLDHELAVYNSLVRHPEKRCIIVGENDICFNAPDELRLDMAQGARLSLFPLAEVKVSGTGLVYPLDGLVMRPWGRIGTSNAVAERGVTLRVDGPGLLVILPRAGLAAAIGALAG